MSDQELEATLRQLIETDFWEWPEEGAETIVRAMRSANASLRELAVDAVVANPVTIDDDIAAELLKVVRSNDDPEVRARAALTFGPMLEMGDDFDWEDDWDEPPVSEARFNEVRIGLEKLYRDETQPKVVRRRLFESLVRDGQPWVEEELRKAYNSGDDEWKTTAVFGMGFTGQFQFNKEILESLAGTDLILRDEAVRAAGAQGLVESGDKIVSIASDASELLDSRLTAIDALAWVDHPEAVELLTFLKHSADADLSEAAEDSLEELLARKAARAADDEYDDDEYDDEEAEDEEEV